MIECIKEIKAYQETYKVQIINGTETNVFGKIRTEIKNIKDLLKQYNKQDVIKEILNKIEIRNSEFKTNPKNFYNKILNKTTSRIITDKINYNDNILVNPSQIQEAIEEYYTTLFKYQDLPNAQQSSSLHDMLKPKNKYTYLYSD